MAQNTSTAVMQRRIEPDTRFQWIPPCRKQLERATDYPAEAA